MPTTATTKSTPLQRQLAPRLRYLRDRVSALEDRLRKDDRNYEETTVRQLATRIDKALNSLDAAILAADLLAIDPATEG